MEKETREIGVLQNAIDAFYKTTGLHFMVEKTQPAALLRLVAHGMELTFVVEIKTRLTTATIWAALYHLRQYPQKGLLVANYVNPNMAERLREMKVAFIDAAGNAYINEPPLMIHIKGNRPKEEFKLPPTRRTFQPTGLKVLYALLCEPDFLNAPYRDIAKAANVGLGTVGWILTDLREFGYLLEMGKLGRRLVNKEELLERWVAAYPERLRPKLAIGRYKAPDRDWWKDAALGDYGAYWGAEVAAARMTRYLMPEFVTIYTKELPGKLQLFHKLKKDPQGDIEILKTFWTIECNRFDRDIVPPLLVYADLLATGDDRNIETARIIYERHLTRLVRQG